MKILIVMDPGIMIPLKDYGGHERLVEMFAKEYLKLGHEVHLLITTGSYVAGCTVHNFGKEGFPPQKKDSRKAILSGWRFVWKNRNKFDLIHNFGRLVYLLPVLWRPVKKLMTYGREISNRNVRIFHRLKGKNIVYTACSANLLSRVFTAGNWEVVYNAIAFEKYTLRNNFDEKAPLIFLGRIERIKGCHIAIKIARESGNRLLIAGNISSLPKEKMYFETEIEPHIDGKQIQYLGPLNDKDKNFWLAKSKALLFPINWNEPFGIVMLEAMACGTPVIAFNRGSVEEVIDEGITGYKVKTYDEMISAVAKIGTIDRQNCRSTAEKRFDVSVIARKYLEIIDSHRKVIVIVTTGQPAANPRVVKEYEALTTKGYRVKTLYTYSAAWSYEIDEDKYFSDGLKRQDFVLIGGNPRTSKFNYFISRVQFRLIKSIVNIFPLIFLKEMATARSSLYLWIFARNFKADIYIAHYLGALPAAIKAARKYGGSVIFDAEDYHRGEDPYNASLVKHIIEIEDRLLPKVNLITAASPLICKKYELLYPKIKTIAINNAFSRRHLQTFHQNNHPPLKLFWFSQHIGPYRGLEIIVEALNLIDFEVTLSLLGNDSEIGYVDSLLKRSQKPEKVMLLTPVSPDQIFKTAAEFDIGIAAEIPYSENRNVCLTNKIFTYIMAGNCVLASDTDAQKDFMVKNSSVGFCYKNDDPHDLAKYIIQLNNNRSMLNDCKKNALSLADHSLNWECEQSKLFAAVDHLLCHDN